MTTADLVAALNRLEAEFDFYAEMNFEGGFHHAAERNRKGAALVKVAKAVDAHLAAPTVSSGHEVGIALAALREQLNHEQEER